MFRNSRVVCRPEVMEDNLNPYELVRVVALEVEAVVAVQMFPHHLHYSVYNDLDDVALLYQLPGLKKKDDNVKCLQPLNRVKGMFFFHLLTAHS